MLLKKGFKLLQALVSDHSVASVHGVHSNVRILCQFWHRIWLRHCWWFIWYMNMKQDTRSSSFTSWWMISWCAFESSLKEFSSLWLWSHDIKLFISNTNSYTEMLHISSQAALSWPWLDQLETWEYAAGWSLEQSDRFVRSLLQCCWCWPFLHLSRTLLGHLAKRRRSYKAG